MKPKLEQSVAWLNKRWVEDRKSLEEMAVEAKCSKLTIRRRLRENGLLR